MHIIRYKWDSLYYLIPKFEPDQMSSSRDIPLFHAFWSQGCKKQQKWMYLWNYSSDSAQILGSSSWDCLACTLWSAFTPKSIPFSRKTGVQLEWQCPTLMSLHCIHSSTKKGQIKIKLYRRNNHAGMFIWPKGIIWRWKSGGLRAPQFYVAKFHKNPKGLTFCYIKLGGP